VVDPEVDLFAREGTFIERVLVGLLGQCPGLEVVLDITTERAPAFVPAGPERLA
jgi:dihydroorotase